MERGRPRHERCTSTHYGTTNHQRTTDSMTQIVRCTQRCGNRCIALTTAEPTANRQSAVCMTGGSSAPGPSRSDEPLAVSNRWAPLLVDGPTAPRVPGNTGVASAALDCAARSSWPPSHPAASMQAAQATTVTSVGTHTRAARNDAHDKRLLREARSIHDRRSMIATAHSRSKVSPGPASTASCAPHPTE